MVRNIQVLRAAAALAVVLHHLQTQISLNLGMPHLGYWGRAGVDVFFVISGFIMFHTTRDGTRTVGQFWTDRIVRIVPMYWLCTFLIVGLVLVGLHPLGVQKISGEDVVQDLLFVPNYRADGDTYPILDVGWTLDFEMFFYLLFGLTFFLRSQVASFIILACAFLGLAVADRLVHLPYPIHYLSQPITLEFAAGAGLALIYRLPLVIPPRLGRVVGWLMIASGTAAIFVGAWYVGARLNDDFLTRAIVYGIPSVAIVSGALVLERAGATARSPTLLLLGASSYALYLVHHAVVQYMAKAAGLVLPHASPVEAILVAAVILAVAVAAGIFAHQLLEQPMARLLKGFRGRKPAVVAAE